MYGSNFKKTRGDNTRRFADQNAGFRLRQQAAEENARGKPGDRPSGRPKDRSCRTADQARKLPPGRAVFLFPLEGTFWTAADTAVTHGTPVFRSGFPVSQGEIFRGA